ncbi:hypothetical protein [Pseudomonas shahriarae]|uniref:hypothetical protein n=1 Tax=Pseudomonas shahriarae TaxID=2745512 RepID=UPI00249BC983|nr:hypothetical protein [Pseudomonas shahriarae]MDI3206659.1 hypothetical protein [Pseudomonas shahriarae]
MAAAMVLHNLLSQAKAVNQEQLLSDCYWHIFLRNPLQKRHSQEVAIRHESG